LSASSISDVTVQTTVSNTGRFGGHEIIQVYASPSESIRENGLQSFPKTLVGFTKVWVPAGESRDVSIIVRNEDFRWYDVKVGSWRIDTGTYTFFVGTSVRDIVCKLKFNIV
jgi:hypothetical protein